MKVKRYRADTKREALEQIKRELGENTLVLDSKRVRAGGFLGLGAREQFEVRVALDSVAPEISPAKALPSARRKGTMLGLDLMSDASAHPARDAARGEQSGSSAFAALSARAYSSISANHAAHALGAVFPENANQSETKETELTGIEVAATAPRVLHRQHQPAPAQAPEFKPQTDASTVRRHALSGELEQLRAEMREIKFSLGTLAARPHALAAPLTAAPNGQNELSADLDIYDSPYYEAYLEMTEVGLAPELAQSTVRAAVSDDMPEIRESSVIGREGLTDALSSGLKFADDPLSGSPGETNAFTDLVFIGPTGVGKTTTIAKLAARLTLGAHRRVELITLDTYRIGAVEQLKTYADIIGVGCHIARSVVELEALTQRYAGKATLLIDTIGRSPYDLAGEMELADYLSAHQELRKCLVLQATMNPADALAVAQKFSLYGADCLAITKFDETARPGAMVQVALDTRLPLAYLCAGQRVPADLEIATPKSLAGRVLRGQTNSRAAAMRAAA